MNTLNNQVLSFVKLTKNAITPLKTLSGAAGFDLFSAYEYEVQPGGKELVLTDIQIEPPFGTYVRKAPRSSLTHNHFIDVGGRIIILLKIKFNV